MDRDPKPELESITVPVPLRQKVAVPAVPLPQLWTQTGTAMFFPKRQHRLKFSLSFTGGLTWSGVWWRERRSVCASAPSEPTSAHSASRTGRNRRPGQRQRSPARQGASLHPSLPGRAQRPARLVLTLPTRKGATGGQASLSPVQPGRSQQVPGQSQSCLARQVATGARLGLALSSQVGRRLQPWPARQGAARLVLALSNQVGRNRRPGSHLPSPASCTEITPVERKVVRLTDPVRLI